MKISPQFLVVCTIATALQTIRPGAQWTVTDESYSTLSWVDKSQAKPTENEVSAAIQGCKTADTSRLAVKAQAKLDVKSAASTQAQKMQALLILLDLDQ